MESKVGIVLAVLFGLIASPSFAQPRVTGGVKGGLNLANLSLAVDVVPAVKSKVAGAVGGFVTVAITDMIAFQPELLFSMKGAKADEGGVDFKVNLTYVQIPILLQANFRTSGSVHPFVIVGPGLGLRMNAKVRGFGGEEDINDDTKSTDFSAIIGGGVKVGRATIEARYDLGLTDINSTDDGQTVKTRTITILFGFGLGGQ